MGLNPFFSYFGSKFRLAKLYSPPKYNTIIEPFAGSAGYSLLYPDSNVYLYETYEPVAAVWDYLIHVSEKELLSLPLGPFDKYHPVDDEKIPEAAKILLGFWLTESQTYASRYPQSKSRGGNWTERKRKLLAEQVQYIRHWKIKNKSFDEIDNKQATWFVDPPYQEAGKRYRHNKIDFDFLGQWCKKRIGHVIVCEQYGADWMNFKPLSEVKNASNKIYKEVVWEKNK